MRRALPLLLFVTTAAMAQVHGRAVIPFRPDSAASSVSGTVSAINGALIQIANGTITIDTTGAKIAGDEMAPGAFIIATLKSGDVAPNAPLLATTIMVAHVPQAALTGTVTAVDLAGSNFTMLGRTIKVTGDTAFSGLLTLKRMSLSDLFPSMFVAVEAKVVNGALTARSVEILTPLRIAPVRFTGFVKTIGAKEWIVGVGPAGSLAPDFLVTVDANTKISGDPKVGDRVIVVGELTGTGLAAQSITKIP